MGVDREAFRALYAVLVEGERPRLSGELLERCLEAAARNKVLLHFMRAVDYRGGDRLREEARYRRFLEALGTVARALKDLDHAFIKLVKPVTYVPSDIDVLIDRRDVGRAVSRLRSKGFEIEVVEPYCVTMRRRSTVVDLYIYPTIGGVIYIDAKKLLEHRRTATINTIEIPALETWVESLLAAAHAIYKERIYTLNDLITVDKWLNTKTIELAKHLKCTEALQIATTIHHQVKTTQLTLPHRIPLATWIRTLATKTRIDKLSRATLPNLAKALKDPRIGKHITSKLTRETY